MPGDWARPVVHWELLARDPKALHAFYAELFHWDVEDAGFLFIVEPGSGGRSPDRAGHHLPDPRPGGHSPDPRAAVAARRQA